MQHALRVRTERTVRVHCARGRVEFVASRLVFRISGYRAVALAACALLLVDVMSANGAEDHRGFPVRPLRVVTGSPAGGGDLAARLIAPGLAEVLGQPVIVDNRGGANGAIAAEIVVQSPPDGHTVFVYTSSIWVLPFLHKGLAWNPLRDFSPVTLMASSPNVVVVPPTLPASSVSELIALARARPGELNFGASAGSSSHLAGALFNAMAGVRLVHIPYKGSGPALNDLLGGQLHVMFAVTPAAMPHVRSGRLRVLAVTSAKPSALLPGVATVAATVPGYESVTMVAMLAPARTPAAVVGRLQRETEKILRRAAVSEKFFAIGTEVIGGTPAALALAMQSEMARMGKIITDAGIREE
jgi:tripartite-type tricarboxylate transporter receptor subunit TctC